MPNLSTVPFPLHRFLQKEINLTWTEEQQRSFDEVKSLFASGCLLVHYDPSKELVVACDTSLWGVGAVFSHREDDGQKKPIAFASKSLGAGEIK